MNKLNCKSLMEPDTIIKVLKEDGIRMPTRFAIDFCMSLKEWLDKYGNKSLYTIKGTLGKEKHDIIICTTRLATGGQFIWSSGYKYNIDFSYNNVTEKNMFNINDLDKLPQSILKSGNVDLIKDALRNLK